MKMPNFLIIGAPKSGTTSLYHYLKQHPDIYLSPHKEPRFFAFTRQNLSFSGPGDNRIFVKNSVFTLDEYQTLFEGVANQKAIGEASAIYLQYPGTAQRIKSYIPEVKLIAILRDPVERAYSNFLMNIKRGKEPCHSFARALEEEKNRLANNWAPIWLYKERGFYYRQLQQYYALFPQQNIKVYLTKDLSQNPTRVFRDIFRFLEVDENFQPDTSSRHNTAFVPRNRILHSYLNKEDSLATTIASFAPNNIGYRALGFLKNLNSTTEKPSVPQKIRKQLIDVYREDILKLQDLLDRDLSQWLR